MKTLLGLTLVLAPALAAAVMDANGTMPFTGASLAVILPIQAAGLWLAVKDV